MNFTSVHFLQKSNSTEWGDNLLWHNILSLIMTSSKHLGKTEAYVFAQMYLTLIYQWFDNGPVDHSA